MPYRAFTGPNGAAISEAAAALQPGGRLIIDTGSGVSTAEVVGLMNAAGLTSVEAGAAPSGAVRITGIK